MRDALRFAPMEGAQARSLHRKVVMDFVFLALTLFLFALTFGLVRLCERV